MRFFYGKAWRWVLMLVVALFVGWLWASWRSGWFPFKVQGTITQQTQQSILDSLTAPRSPTNNPIASILDSLTPKK